MSNFCELQNDVLSILVGAWEGSFRIFSKNFHNSNATIPLEEGSQALLHYLIYLHYLNFCPIYFVLLQKIVVLFTRKPSLPLEDKIVDY